MQDPKSFVNQLLERVRDYSKLSIENFRLLLAEKLTTLLSMLALAAVVFGLALVMFFFITVCVAHLLADVMPIAWAYAIMAGFNMLAIGACILFRRQLLIDPIARFITRVILS